jgi:putative hydrolase of the HAD superfamily
MSTVRCITFDLDDTLWETGPVLYRAEEALLDWIERHLPRVAAAHDANSLVEHRREFYATLPELRYDVSALRRRWLVEIAAAFDYDATLAEEGFHHFWLARNQVETFDHVPDALTALGARYRLGTITNGNADVHHIGIGHHFDFVVTAADAGAAKPDRGIFEHALTLAGVPAEETVHVGDDPVRDIEGARAARMRTVWVNPARSTWSGAEPPDGEVRGIDELEALLLRWSAAPPAA